MNRAEYLIARGWARTRSQLGDLWRDPVYVAADGSVDLTTRAYLSEEEAERRQLDRDAVARDYLEARRPGVVQVVMAGIFAVPDSDNGEKVLLGKRSEGCEFSGQWCLPGGKVEPGESLEEALVRELREEVGASFETSDILSGEMVYHFDPPVVKKRVRIYYFELGHREGMTYAPLDGLDAVQWFTPEEVGELAMTPATREALRWWASPPLHMRPTCR